MDSVGTGEGGTVPGMSERASCQDVCVTKQLSCVSHSFKIQTLEAFLVDGLFELLFTQTIKG